MATNFAAITGNGNGVVVFLNDVQVSGAIYSAAYLGELGKQKNIANQKKAVATNQGIVENTNDNRKIIFSRIRDTFLRYDNVPSYEQFQRVYYNQVTDWETLIDDVASNGFGNFLADGNTIELTVAEDTNGLLENLV
jgi:hypothetical protein